MAKIDLYYPSYTSTFENWESQIVPPLGLMSLASTLRCEGHNSRIIDFRLCSDAGLTLDAALSGRKPDVIGVSTVTQMANEAYALIRSIRDRDARIPIILGVPSQANFWIES